MRNENNLGFPAGCNQGLGKARGQFLIFLNNDTVVGPHWLEGLVNASLADWPNVGAVGAVSNYVPAPQLVEPGYRDLVGLPAFADWRRSEFAGRSLTVERLSGFCLLIRREVVNRVGAFDERFGMGFFDDADLGIRIREAGFQLRVALDVFVHHFGSRTFLGLGIDCQQQLTINFESFKAKWGSERTAGYRLPAAQKLVESLSPLEANRTGQSTADFLSLGSALRTEPPFRISLSMIVKNEEHNLSDCLNSVADLVDELVVVDTGSQDATRQIAERFGACVPEFPWVDSFADARNESVRHCTGDWIFWMDADDRIDEENRTKLRLLFDRLRQGLPGVDNGTLESSSPLDAFVMTCRCVASREDGTVTDVQHVRLFRNHPGIRWEHRIHEQILPGVRRAGGVPRFCDVVIHHVGYQDTALRLKKRERDLRLLKLELQEKPDHPFTLFNLGMTYLDMQQPGEALPLLESSLSGSAPTDSIVRKLYYLIVQCYRQMERPDRALNTCRQGRIVYPQDAELLAQEASLLVDCGDLDGARSCYETLLTSRESAHFASVPIGLHGYLSRHNLAIVSLRQNQLEEAESHWRNAISEKPDFELAWSGLEDLFVRQERWSDLDWLAGEVDRHLPAAHQGDVTRARGFMERGEFVPARGILQELIVKRPELVRPRVILSHVLLKEGSDLATAEQILDDILVLAPDYTEVRQNLEVLRSRKSPDQNHG